jgi:hypothetical protein
MTSHWMTRPLIWVRRLLVAWCLVSLVGLANATTRLLSCGQLDTLAIVMMTGLATSLVVLTAAMSYLLGVVSRELDRCSRVENSAAEAAPPRV